MSAGTTAHATGTARSRHRPPTRRERFRNWRQRLGSRNGRRGPLSLLFGTPRGRDMKRRWPLSLFLLAIYIWLGFTTAADHKAPVTWPRHEGTGFWSALIDGFSIPFNWIYGLFIEPTVTIYQAPNDWKWYNTGYVLGIVLLFLFVKFLFRIKMHVLRSQRTELPRVRTRVEPPRPTR